MAPDGFKDFYQSGYSIHGQYVIFPTPRIGISIGGAYEFFLFDNDAYIDDLYEDLDYLFPEEEYSTEGSASIIELGLGLRPYLTSPTSSFQFFLFGMGTFNIFNSEVTEEYDFYYTYLGETYHAVGDSTYDSNVSKIGFSAGAGFEIPAGQVNIIVQGLVRFMPSIRTVKSKLDESWGEFWSIEWEEKEEPHSFVGITAGIVF